MRQFEWYTNGNKNKKVFIGQEVPEGFKKGFSLKKSTKDRKSYTMKLAAPERLNERRQAASEKLLASMEVRLSKTLGFKTVDKKIRALVRNHSVEDVYSKLKFSDYNDDFILNRCLRTLIVERTLIFQLDSMPKYYKTIFESLEELYTKNPLLQKRSSVQNYFLSSIRSDFEAVSVLYGSAVTRLF